MTPDLPGEYVLGTAAFVIGTLVGVNASFDLYYGLRSFGWPTVSGRIIDRGHSLGPTRYPVDDMVLLAYSYTVDGERFVGTRFDYAGHNTMRRSASLEREYPLHGRVTVHYDPSNPSRAVLRPGIGFWNLLPISAAGLMMYFGALPAHAVVAWALA